MQLGAGAGEAEGRGSTAKVGSNWCQPQPTCFWAYQAHPLQETFGVGRLEYALDQAILTIHARCAASWQCGQLAYLV